MPHQDFDRVIVGMGVQIEIVGHGEVDGLLDPFIVGAPAREMKLADAAIVAALEFVLHQIEDDGILEPGLDIGADPVRPDERHDLQARSAFAPTSAWVPVLGRLVARMPVTRCFLNSASTSSSW